MHARTLSLHLAVLGLGGLLGLGPTSRAEAQVANLAPLAAAATPRVLSSDVAGTTVEVRLRVFNPGGAPMRGIALSDELAAGVTLVESQPSASVSGARLRWNLGTLPAGEFATVRLRLAVPTPAPAALDTGAVARALLEGVPQRAVAARVEVRAIAPADAPFLAASVTADPADALVAERVGQLGADPAALFAHVRDDLGVEVYRGALRGARGALLAHAANGYDRAALLVALLRAAGYPARFRFGTLSDADAARVIDRMFPDPAFEALATPHPDAAALLGLDRLNRLSALMAPEERAARSADEIAALSASEAAALLSAAPRADAALLADARDHAWVEYLEGAAWVALDPSFADATRGDARATVVGDPAAEIPEASRHRLRFVLHVETRDPGWADTDHVYPLSRELSAAELAGVSLTVRQSVAVSVSGGLFTTRTHRYTPRFVLTDLVDGDVRVHEAVTPYEELDSTFGGTLTRRIATGCWIEVEHLAPGESMGEGDVERWAIFDRMGAAARALGGTPPSGFPDPVLVDLRSLTISASGGAVPGRLSRLARGELAQLAGRLAPALEATAGMDLEDPAIDDDPEAREAASLMRETLDLLQASVGAMFQASSDRGARSMATVHRVRAYLARPRLTFVRSEHEEVEGAHRPKLAIDLRVNDVRVVPYPGQAPGAAFHLRLARGFLDAVYERQAMRLMTGLPTVSTVDVMDGVVAMGIPVLALPPVPTGATVAELVDALGDIPAPDDAKVHIAEALRAGRGAMIPLEPAPLPDGGEGYAWWELSNDGEIVGVTADGGHAALIEYGIILARGVLCNGNPASGGCGLQTFIGAMVGMSAAVLSFVGQVLEEGGEIKAMPDTAAIVTETVRGAAESWIRELAYRVPTSAGTDRMCIGVDIDCRGLDTCESVLLRMARFAPMVVGRVSGALCNQMYGAAAASFQSVFDQLQRGFEVDPPPADFATAFPPVRGLTILPLHVTERVAAASGLASPGAIDETFTTDGAGWDGPLARAEGALTGALGLGVDSLIASGADVTRDGAAAGSGDLAVQSLGGPVRAALGPGGTAGMSGDGTLGLYAEAGEVISGATWRSASLDGTAPTTTWAFERVIADGAETRERSARVTLGGVAQPAGVYGASAVSVAITGSGAAWSLPAAAAHALDASGAALTVPGRTAYRLASGASVDATPSGTSVSLRVAGDVERAVEVEASPARLTLPTTGEAVLTPAVRSTVGGDHVVRAVGPLGWTLRTDAAGAVRARAPSGTPAGSYAIVVSAQPADGLGPMAAVVVPVDLGAPSAGVELAIVPDPTTSVPLDGANVPTAFLLEPTNRGGAADVYALAVDPIAATAIALGAGSLGVRPGETGRTALRLTPTGGLPAAGTIFPITARATGAAASDEASLAFSMPEVWGASIDPLRRAVNLVPGGSAPARFSIRATGNVATELGLALSVSAASGALSEPSLTLPLGGVAPIAPTLTAGASAAVGQRGHARLFGELAVGAQAPLPPTDREGRMRVRIVSPLGLAAWDLSDELAVRSRGEAALAAELLGESLDAVALGCTAGDAESRDAVVGALRRLVTALGGDFAIEAAALSATADAVAAATSCAGVAAVDFGPIGALTDGLRAAEPEVALAASVDPSAATVGVGGEVTLALTIRNAGVIADLYALEAAAPAGWEVVLPAGGVPAAAGAERVSGVLVRVPAGAAVGASDVTFTVTSGVDPSVTASASARLEVREDVGVTVRVDPARLAASADAVARLRATVTNRESAALGATLSLDGAAAVAAALSETELRVEGGGAASSELDVTRPGEQLASAVHGLDVRARTAMNAAVGHADLEVLDHGRIGLRADPPLLYTSDEALRMRVRNLAGPAVMDRVVTIDSGGGGAGGDVSVAVGAEASYEGGPPAAGVSTVRASDGPLSAVERVRVVDAQPLEALRPEGCGSVVVLGDARGGASALEAAVSDAQVVRAAGAAEALAALGGDDRAVLVVLEPDAALLADPALRAAVEGGDGVLVLPGAVSGEDDLMPLLGVRAVPVDAVELHARMGAIELDAIGPGLSLVGEVPAIRGLLEGPAEELAAAVSGPLRLSIEGDPAGGALSIDVGTGAFEPFGGESRAADTVLLARVPAGQPIALRLGGAEGTLERGGAAGADVDFGGVLVRVRHPDAEGMNGVWSGAELGDGRVVALHVDLLASARRDPAGTRALEEALRAACGSAPLSGDAGEDGGCGCRAVGAGPSAPLGGLGLAALGLLGLVRRRRRRRGEAGPGQRRSSVRAYEGPPLRFAARARSRSMKR